jgi:hypothetical protein
LRWTSSTPSNCTLNALLVEIINPDRVAFWQHRASALDLPLHAVSPDVDRSAMMPRRKQTRDQDRRDRITAERRQRCELIAEEERQRRAWLAAHYRPPSF